MVTASGNVGPSYDNYKAFDGGFTDTNSWVASAGACWLQIDLGPGHAYIIGSYAITGAEASWSPSAWTLQGSNDGTTFTTVDTETGQSFTTANQTKSYTVASPGSVAFRYWRINISANNGSGSYTGIEELYLTNQATSPFTSGSTGDFYFAGGAKAIYGPKSGTSTWPLFGTVN